MNEYSSRTLHGHDHSISSARFVAGDDFIVSASRDCTIKVWDVTNGWCVKTFSGHGQWVRCVVPSDDGKLLASCSDDQVRSDCSFSQCFCAHTKRLNKTARIWDMATGETKLEFRGHENYLEVVVFAPVASYQSISELSGIALVSLAMLDGSGIRTLVVIANVPNCSPWIKPKPLASSSPLGHEISLLNCGMPQVDNASRIWCV